MIGNKQQIAAAAYPIPHGIAFFFGKTPVDQPLHHPSLRRPGHWQSPGLLNFPNVFPKRLPVRDHAITVTADQIDKRLVTPGGRMKVIMGFIKQHARQVLVVSRIRNGCIEIRIGDLLALRRSWLR